MNHFEKVHNLILSFMAWSVIVEILLITCLLSFYFLVFTGRVKLTYSSIQEKCKEVCTPQFLKQELYHVNASKTDFHCMEDAFIRRVVTEALRNHAKNLLSYGDILEAKAELAWIARKYWWIHVGAKAKRELQSSNMGEPS